MQTVESTTGAQTTQAARRLGTYLEKSSADHLPSEFRNQVLEILELEPNITRVDVYADFSGELKSVESSSSRGDRPLEGQEISAFYDSQSDTFIVGKGVSREIFSVYPIRFNDGQQGFVTVVSSLEAVDEILKTHSRIRLYSLVATTFLLVGAITWLFRTKVYRSVFHLVEVMHRFKGGDSSARAREDMTGELGELARNLNYMLEEMGKFSNHLQSQVKTAVDQLAHRNRELQELNSQHSQKELVLRSSCQRFRASRQHRR